MIRASSTGSTNFMYDKIIGQTNSKKIISKETVQFVLGNKSPLQILHQNNTFTIFLRKQCPQYLQQFSIIYDYLPEFKLTKYGEFCGYYEKKGNTNKQMGMLKTSIKVSDVTSKQQKCYVVFSQHLISFIDYECKNESNSNKGWFGFVYRVGVSAYVGGLDEMKSHGQGRALYLQKYYLPDQNSQKLMYNLFEGRWKLGEIQEGTRKTYEKYVNEQPIIEYKGKFQKFVFHDSNGTLFNKKLTLSGKFQKGNYIKQNTVIEQSAPIKTTLVQSLQKIPITKVQTIVIPSVIIRSSANSKQDQTHQNITDEVEQSLRESSNAAKQNFKAKRKSNMI